MTGRRWAGWTYVGPVVEAHGVRVSEAYECPCPECSAWEAWHLDQPVPGPSWVASLRVVFLDDSGRVRYLEHVPQTDLERP